MGHVTFSEQDIKRGTLLEPNWYLCEITDVTEKESKTDRSTNFVIDFKLIDNNAELNGVPVRRYFNEKVPNFMKSFIEVFSGGKIEVGKRYEITRDLVGKQLMINVVRGDNSGTPTNEAKDFAPKGAPVR